MFSRADSGAIPARAGNTDSGAPTRCRGLSRKPPPARPSARNRRTGPARARPERCHPRSASAPPWPPSPLGRARVAPLRNQPGAASTPAFPKPGIQTHHAGTSIIPAGETRGGQPLPRSTAATLAIRCAAEAGRHLHRHRTGASHRCHGRNRWSQPRGTCGHSACAVPVRTAGVSRGKVRIGSQCCAAPRTGAYWCRQATDMFTDPI